MMQQAQLLGHLEFALWATGQACGGLVLGVPEQGATPLASS